MGFWKRKKPLTGENAAKPETLGADQNSPDVESYPGNPRAIVTRDPMPLAFRDLNEHDVFEIEGCLFIRMSDGSAVCFKSSRCGYVKLGKWKPNELTHVRLVTDIYARVEGGKLTRGKFGDI